MKKNQKAVIALAIAAVVIVAAVAIALTSGAPGESKKQIKLGYVLWDGEIASSNVIKLVLEEAGHDVELVNVDAGILYQGLANGELDFTVSAWLPATQKNYWDTYGDRIDSVATNLEGCRIGLAVPSYMTSVNSISDLNGHGSEFQGRIVGIDPGAGIMATTEDAISSYGLDYELEASSNAAMLAELTSAYNGGEPIVVTLWSPHWAFANWDLKYLEDPQGAYGGAEHVQTLARTGFQADKPEAYAIIERFNWTQDDIQSVMMDISGGMSEEAAAKKWIDANRDKVDQWING